MRGEGSALHLQVSKPCLPCSCAARTKSPNEQQGSVLYTRLCMAAHSGPCSSNMYCLLALQACLLSGPHLTSHVASCICLAPCCVSDS